MIGQQFEHPRNPDRERPLSNDGTTHEIATHLGVTPRSDDAHFIEADLELLNGGEIDQMMCGLAAGGVESLALLYAVQQICEGQCTVASREEHIAAVRENAGHDVNGSVDWVSDDQPRLLETESPLPA